MPIELELSKFDPRILEKRRLNNHAPIIVFIGARGSGKSVLIKDILSYFDKKMPFVCFSGTEKENGYFEKFIHKVFIYHDFDKEVVENIIDNQGTIVEGLKKQGLDPTKHPDKSVGLIFDDLAYDKGIMKNECIKEIFFNGRHKKLVSLFSFQYMLGLSPDLRTNVDYVFVLAENRKDSIEKLYKYYFGIFDKLADFKKVLQKCTDDYGCLVLDNTSRSHRIEDCVFWYKAEINRDFKICEHMWPTWDKLIKKESEKTFKRPQKTSDIIVKKKNVKMDDEDDDY